MLTLTEIFILFLLVGGGWYWHDAMRAKELAREAGRRRCAEAGVTFLDDTVALARLRLRRDEGGQVNLYREFRFEFTGDGSARHGGEIALLGTRILRVEMEAYRMAPPPGVTVEIAPDPADRKWLH
jgi:hypothetical protein